MLALVKAQEEYSIEMWTVLKRCPGLMSAHFIEWALGIAASTARMQESYVAVLLH